LQEEVVMEAMLVASTFMPKTMEFLSKIVRTMLLKILKLSTVQIFKNVWIVLSLKALMTKLLAGLLLVTLSGKSHSMAWWMVLII